MTDPVQLLIEAGAIPSTPFVPQSRYSGVPLALLSAAPGRAGRGVCAPALHSGAGRAGDRRARTWSRHWIGPTCWRRNTSATRLLYWRIADANAVVDPNELTDTLGRRSISRSRREREVMIMQGGIKLSLFIGTVPVPAPQEAVEALTSVKVEAGSGETQSGFELTFELPARSRLRTLFLLTGGGSVPLMRVVLVVQIGGRAEPLIDGVTTNVETQPGEGGVSRLDRQGQGPLRVDGHRRADRRALPGDAAVDARATDPRQVRGPRRDSDRVFRASSKICRSRSSASRSSAAPTTVT